MAQRIEQDQYLGVLGYGDVYTFRYGVTGELLRSFNHNAMVETSELETHLRSLIIVLESLKLIDASANARQSLPQEMDWDAVEVALWEAVIIGYCRCFDGNGRFPIDPSSYLSADQLELHQYLHALRNKHVAHDLNFHRGADAAIGVDASGKVVAIHTLSTVASKPVSWTADVVRLVQVSVDELGKRKKAKAFEIMAALSLLSPEQVLELPTFRKPADEPDDPLRIRKRVNEKNRKPKKD